MPSKFGGVPVEEQASGSKYGGVPVDAAPAPVQPSAPSAPASRGFLGSMWDATGAPIVQTVKDAGQALAPPSEESNAARERLAAIPTGIARQFSDSLAGMGHSLVHGDVPGLAYHTAGLVPGIGPTFQQGSNQLASGDVSSGLGTLAGGATAAMAPEIAPKVGGLVRTVADAAPAVPSMAKGALKGAADASSEMVTLPRTHGLIKAPLPIAGGVGGAMAGHYLAGTPGGYVGGALGALWPPTAGAFKGARQGLADFNLAQDIANKPPRTGPIWKDLPQGNVTPFEMPPTKVAGPSPTVKPPLGEAAPLVQAPAPAAAAVSAPDKLLEDVAQGQAGKSYSRLSPKEKAAVDQVASRLRTSDKPAPAPTAAPEKTLVNTAPDADAITVPKEFGNKDLVQSDAAPLLPGHQRVSSVMARSHGFNPDNGQFEVHFKSGQLYRYPELPPEEVERLKNSESIGAYFREHIRPKYTGVRVDIPR